MLNGGAWEVHSSHVVSLKQLFLSLPSPSRTNRVKILNVPPFHHHQLAESTQSSQRAEVHTSPSVTRSAAMALEKGLEKMPNL